VCDLEISKTKRLKPATGLWKIQPQWVVTPGKQTKKVKVKVKESRNRPGVAQRVPGGLGSQIS
jgi:hypothetical protein